jgi:glycosyltransferase involved in cell wall biosynthesis
VEPEDVDGLTSALGLLAGDEELRQRLGRAGAQRVVQHFEVGLVARRMVALYRELVA